jgi:hypothetical protein
MLILNFQETTRVTIAFKAKKDKYKKLHIEESLPIVFKAYLLVSFTELRKIKKKPLILDIILHLVVFYMKSSIMFAIIHICYFQLYFKRGSSTLTCRSYTRHIFERLKMIERNHKQKCLGKRRKKMNVTDSKDHVRSNVSQRDEDKSMSIEKT